MVIGKILKKLIFLIERDRETERQIYLNRKREGNIDEEERTEERKGEKIIHPINSQQ